MEFRSTCIKTSRRSAFTLVEVMVASLLSVILAGSVASLVFFSSRSFVTMANYTDMSERSQIAVDKMAKDIRQTKQLTAYTPSSLTFKDADGNPLQFTFNSGAKTLVRVSGGKTNVFLKDVAELSFGVYQHTMKSNQFVCYDVAAVTNARVIQMYWTCSRDILGKKATTESVQTAEIVMRNH